MLLFTLRSTSYHIDSSITFASVEAAFCFIKDSWTLLLWKDKCSMAKGSASGAEHVQGQNRELQECCIDLKT